MIKSVKILKTPRKKTGVAVKTKQAKEIISIATTEQSLVPITLDSEVEVLAPDQVQGEDSADIDVISIDPQDNGVGDSIDITSSDFTEELLDTDERLDSPSRITSNKKNSSRRALVPYSPLEAYLSEIRQFTPISREEEHEVAVEYQKTKSPEAAFKLVSSNLWLVVKLARDYERVARNVLDLIQEGNIGLMEAVRNFDPYRGVRFPSYAVWWIRAYIIRFIIANWRLVKIGTTQAQRKLFFNLKKEMDKLERQGIYPTAKLLADKLNVREGDVVEMSQRMSGSDVSVDAPLQDDSDSSLLSILPSGKESIEDTIAHRQMMMMVRSTVSEFEALLTDKEKLIFHGRIVDEEKKTLQEISDQLSLSKERVRQIENKLKEKLKVYLSKQLGSELDGFIEPVSDVDQTHE